MRLREIAPKHFRRYGQAAAGQKGDRRVVDARGAELLVEDRVHVRVVAEDGEHLLILPAQHELDAAVLVTLLLLPVPEGLKPKAWGLVAIFLTTIVAIILKVMPIGVMAVIPSASDTISERYFMAIETGVGGIHSRPRIPLSA